ncbi:hypothetical protein HY634_04440 [Candidatus Uhrbacteria bacterium]|nr:hypothetical protein [Candidatus Uhrbacteria bacterium]
MYSTDVERTRLAGDDVDPDWVTEADASRAEAACGCVIGDDVKPRFHRDGTLVCSQHYYYCGTCGLELLPLELVVVDKRVFCRGCGERFIDRLIWSEFRNPGSVERVQLESLKLQKQELRSRRWNAAWNRLLGRRAGLARR